MKYKKILSVLLLTAQSFLTRAENGMHILIIEDKIYC